MNPIEDIILNQGFTKLSWGVQYTPEEMEGVAKYQDQVRSRKSNWGAGLGALAGGLAGHAFSPQLGKMMGSNFQPWMGAAGGALAGAGLGKMENYLTSTMGDFRDRALFSSLPAFKSNLRS